jgi:hypothetical protein
VPSSPSPGREPAETILLPDEYASEDGKLGWVHRERVPDPGVAILAIAKETGERPDRMQATAVLLREESQVEADINGHEFRLWVECTKRARAAEPYWQVTYAD